MSMTVPFYYGGAGMVGGTPYAPAGGYTSIGSGNISLTPPDDCEVRFKCWSLCCGWPFMGLVCAPNLLAYIGCVVGLCAAHVVVAECVGTCCWDGKVGDATKHIFCCQDMATSTEAGSVR